MVGRPRLRRPDRCVRRTGGVSRNAKRPSVSSPVARSDMGEGDRCEAAVEGAARPMPPPSLDCARGPPPPRYARGRKCKPHSLARRSPVKSETLRVLREARETGRPLVRAVELASGEERLIENFAGDEEIV